MAEDDDDMNGDWFLAGKIIYISAKLYRIWSLDTPFAKTTCAI